MKEKDNTIYKTNKDQKIQKDQKNQIDSTISLLSGSYETVYTPKGSHIQVYKSTDPDYTAAQKQAMHNSFKSTYRFQAYVSPASNRYNCHSYAWYSQSTSNPYWMDTPYCDAYMNDGSYSNVAIAAANDRIHWHDGDHSGIIVGVGSQAGNMSVKSKYGQYGVYTAFIADVDDVYVGGIYDYWR